MPRWITGSLRTGHASGGTVLKLGGSLLGRPGWPDLLAAVVAAHPGPLAILVGGGAVVDGLRRIDAGGSMPAALVHDLAISAMDVTARLVAHAIDLPVADDVPGRPARIVLRAGGWLAAGNRADRLPREWGVTSDSIAALVAAERSAALVLAKSVPPDGTDLDALAAAGWVDRQFPVAARPLTVIDWTAPAET